MLNKKSGQVILILAGLSFGVFSCYNNSTVKDALLNYIKSPAGEGSSLPFLFSNEGEILLSWVERKGDTSSLKYASLKEERWSDPIEMISGKDWFVNWADFPAIAQNKNRILSHILKKSSGGTYSYDVKLNLSDSEGIPLKKDFQLHTDGTYTEHGFVSMLPYKENSFFVTWLDGRNTVGGEHGVGGHQGAMSIRAAEVSDMGAILNEMSLDERVCDCCQTTAAITHKGPVVIYRDRSDEEIRDMSIVRWVDGNWSEPKIIFQDNWKIEGCPVNGPKADSIGNDLAIAWFTAADRKPKVKVVFSSDAGENFEAPIIISEINPAGRVDIAMIDKDNVLVCWLESIEAGNELKVVRVRKTGNNSDPLLVAIMDGSRKSGFPQMELLGDTIYFAWTGIDQNISTVKTAFVRLKNL
jgi:hypothetical protein